jgi:intracellular sulfur oxidation DsrE/DsrF family protein
MKTDNGTRRSILSGFGAAAAAIVLGPRNARAQAVNATFQPARHAQDDWMNALPGKHRTVIDCAAATAAGTGIFYANNIFTGNRNGYQLTDSDVAVIVVLRHQATTYAYNDVIWGKYGSALAKLVQISDPQTKQAPTINPLNSPAFGSATTANAVTVPALVARGVHFGICDMATNRIAGVIAAAFSSTQPAIYKELAENLLPNGHLVAAGVVAINRAQEYGYTMLTAV